MPVEIPSGLPGHAGADRQALNEYIPAGGVQGGTNNFFNYTIIAAVPVHGEIPIVRLGLVTLIANGWLQDRRGRPTDVGAKSGSGSTLTADSLVFFTSIYMTDTSSRWWWVPMVEHQRRDASPRPSWREVCAACVVRMRCIHIHSYTCTLLSFPRGAHA